MNRITGGARIYIGLLFLCCISCKGSLQDEDLETYDIEVINYFYETVFHTDNGRILEEAYRWTGDIPISIHGNLWEYDSLFVQDAVEEINALRLPISLSLTSDSIKSRLKIYFGNDDSATDSINSRKMQDTISVQTSISGEGLLVKMSDSGEILFGDISIFNRSSVYDNLDSMQRSIFRKGVILEEIYQSMGIPGDSFTYYHSAIFEGKNLKDSLSVLNRNVLKFLYSNWGLGKRIRRIEFEERYADVLYNNLTAKKLNELSQEHGLDREDLHLLVDMVFLGDSSQIFTKFPRDIFYKLEGTYTSAEVGFFKVLVGELNNSIPTLKGKFTEENTFWNDAPSLTIHFNLRKEGGEVATIVSQYSVNKIKLMNEYMLSGVTKINLSDPKSKYNNHLMTLATLRGLGLKVTEGDVLRDTSLSNLTINEDYTKYLSLLYDPRFPSGISKSEYQGLLEEMEVIFP